MSENDRAPELELEREGGTVWLHARDGEGGGTAYPLEPAEADALGRELVNAARDADRAGGSSTSAEVVHDDGGEP